MYVKKLLCGWSKVTRVGHLKWSYCSKKKKSKSFSESMNGEAQGMGGDPQEEVTGYAE